MTFIKCLNDPVIELPRVTAHHPGDALNRQTIISHFFQCLRDAKHSRPDVCILLAIQRTADATANSDAYVAKVLVEAGLRAPRMSFPGEYLDYVTQALIRHPHHMGAATVHDKDLYAHWASIGDDPFVGMEWVTGISESRDRELLH